MLDHLRMEFKTSKGMSVKENLREIKIAEFLKGFKRSQKLLAKNGSNVLRIESQSSMPKVILLQQLNVKRVVNNLLSNALKHTKSGSVTLLTGLVKSGQLLDGSAEGLIHVGSKIIPNSKYLMFEIRDDGKGIPKEKLSLIFNEQETDESAENWDGTGLGLPICLTICKNMDAFIKYASQP